MATIYDIVTSKEIASYWTVKSQDAEPYLGESKFPDEKKLGLDLKWVKGVKGDRVKLSLSAFDAKAIPLSRQGVSISSAEMPFFKNSMNIDEKQRQELNKVVESGNQALIDIIAGNIFDDETRLIEDARLTREMLRMQALTTGVISIADNGQSYTYDYGVSAGQKKTLVGGAKWDTPATADPIGDITAWQDEIEQSTGVRPTELLMNRATFNLIKKADAVKNAIYVLGNGAVTPNDGKLKEYIMAETGCTVYVYNKGYTSNGVFTKFVPDGVVVLMPEQALGKTWFGTTPEESDLIGSPNVANVSIVDTGVAVTTTKEVDPVNVMTKVSMICLPSFEMADRIIIATVK